MLNGKLAVKYHHPYSEECAGPGRWYSAFAHTGNPIGFVWTNDRDGFGMITTSLELTDQETIEWFLYNRNVWGENDVTAALAFEAYRELQNVWAPEIASITTGDLTVDLLPKIETETDTMANYIEYGITVGDDGEVLELLRHDPTGSYYRDAGKWVGIDPNAGEEAYPTIYNQEWHEVDEDILSDYDANPDLNIQDVQVYFI